MMSRRLVNSIFHMILAEKSEVTFTVEMFLLKVWFEGIQFQFDLPSIIDLFLQAHRAISFFFFKDNLFLLAYFWPGK